MRLTIEQLEEVRRFLHGHTYELSDELLSSIELRVGMSSGEIADVPTQAAKALQVLEDFREKRLRYLLIRIASSWRCFIRCEDGQIHEATCSETQKDAAVCCEALRSRCLP